MKSMAQISLDVEAARRSSRSFLYSSPRRLVAQLQAQFVVNAMGFLQIDLPSLAAQKDMDASVAVANAYGANPFAPSFETGLARGDGICNDRWNDRTPGRRMRA
jgi:hypothetical protein